jgi:uncharacterized OB-fold protein
MPMTNSGEAKPAWQGLWGRDAGGAYLVAGRCQKCGGYALGIREFCPHCSAQNTLQEDRIGRTGRLYSATVIHQGPNAFNTPYRVGYVDIEGGLRIFAHIEDGTAGPSIGDVVDLDIEARMTDREGHPMTIPIYSAQRGGDAR